MFRIHTNQTYNYLEHAFSGVGDSLATLVILLTMTRPYRSFANVLTSPSCIRPTSKDRQRHDTLSWQAEPNFGSRGDVVVTGI